VSGEKNEAEAPPVGETSKKTFSTWAYSKRYIILLTIIIGLAIHDNTLRSRLGWFSPRLSMYFCFNGLDDPGPKACS
jgi:hypothetical protein